MHYCFLLPVHLNSSIFFFEQTFLTHSLISCFVIFWARGCFFVFFDAATLLQSWCHLGASLLFRGTITTCCIVGGVMFVLALVLLVVRTSAVASVVVGAPAATKRLKRSRKRRRELDLGYGGRKMKLLVMLSYLLDFVWSFDPVPDANGGNVRTSGLEKIVDEWINPATRSSIESTYGPIGDWNTSLVTRMDYLFLNKNTFNEDLLKWQTGKVTNMESSTC